MNNNMPKLPEVVANGLWNENVASETYVSKEKYQDHLFEQYKMFVAMADHVSTRRNLANTFFLTLHTLIVGVVGFLYEKGPHLTNKWVILFPLVAVLVLNYVWWRLILSYRQLNIAKFLVIGEYERQLPSRPFVSAEWKALGEGKYPKLYRPLSDIENWVPGIFACLYFIGAIAIIFYS